MSLQPLSYCTAHQTSYSLMVALMDVPHLGSVTGSGVYRQAESAKLELKVHPAKQGMLNTITLAKLIAILVALRVCRPDEDK